MQNDFSNIRNKLLKFYNGGKIPKFQSPAGAITGLTGNRAAVRYANRLLRRYDNRINDALDDLTDENRLYTGKILGADNPLILTSLYYADAYSDLQLYFTDHPLGENATDDQKRAQQLAAAKYALERLNQSLHADADNWYDDAATNAIIHGYRDANGNDVAGLDLSSYSSIEAYNKDVNEKSKALLASNSNLSRLTGLDGNGLTNSIGATLNETLDLAAMGDRAPDKAKEDALKAELKLRRKDNAMSFFGSEGGLEALSLASGALDSLTGDKNFGAQSQAIDSAVHGVSGALMKSGNPYAMAAGAALEGANALTKMGGQNVQGYDVDINSSGYGNLGHQDSSASRDFGMAIPGLGGLNFNSINKKLARRNEQALMALDAASIADELKLLQEARMNNVLNLLEQNTIALNGGTNLSLLGG